MNGKKWLISDPVYLVTIGFMSLFNYYFDQFFKAVVHLNPYLSFLYVFQYSLILPMINIAIISVLFRIRNAKKNGVRRGS